MPVEVETIEKGATDSSTAPVTDSSTAPVADSSTTPFALAQDAATQDVPIMFDGDVQITDPDAPLVILFGPTSCGKTMTLIRLAKYLHDVLGYEVRPDNSFRPSYDEAYKEDCRKFQQTVNAPLAAAGTSGYMLVDVMKGGKILCKILEAPGEYYFDPSNPKQSYPHYMNKIIMAPNRKVWCAFVEPDWNPVVERSNTGGYISTEQIRADYVSRIKALKPQMKSTDRMIFIFNKIDKTDFVKNQGVVNIDLAMKSIMNFYKGIFSPFKCEIPIVKWFRPYDCSFIPFQSGLFTEDTDRNGTTIQTYTEGPEEYVQNLWNQIKKSI